MERLNILILVSTKENKKIFLTKNTKITNLITRKIDIIISPEFYWVRKFEIPVKTETQARLVLPTLFEDIIDDISILTYQVIKLEENIFLCFAYQNKEIYEAIKRSDIPITQINSLYFAQNECKSFKSFETNSSKFMYTKEGILIKIPDDLLENTLDLEKVIDSIKLSSHKLQIKLYNDVIDTKFYYSLFTIFAVLILMNFLNIFHIVVK